MANARAVAMQLQPNDILLAFKHISLSEELNGTEKQFAAFLVDSYNRKTGRCDPSEETAAFLLQKSVRTIVRAGNKLVHLRLFIRRKHAGHNHCNSYLPNWQFFRESEERFKIRRRERASRFAVSKMSPTECQPRHLSSDNPVTQTSPKEHVPLTYHIRLDDVRSCQPLPYKEKSDLWYEQHDSKLRYLGPPSPSSQDAAEVAAERRWNNGLLDRFGTGPVYETIVEAMDDALQHGATAAEMKRRGAGVDYIVQKLVDRGLLAFRRSDDGSLR